MKRNIGIDLGNHSIKIAQLKEDKGQIYLENFAIYDSDRLVLDFGNQELISIYGKKLKEFFAEVEFDSKFVQLALPESDIFLNTKLLPKMRPDEIKNYINLQASELFPENIKELSFDFKVLNTDTNGMLEVLFVGAKKTKVESYAKLLSQCDLVPKLFEAKTQSLSRIIDDPKEEKYNLVIDFGYNYSTLHISKKRVPRFTKTIPIGSSSINRALMQNLNLSKIQAENYKRSYGLIENVADGKVFSFISPLIDSMDLDIKRSIIYFLDKNKGAEINKIYLVGGLSKLPNLVNYMEKKLNFPVEVFDPFTKIKLDASITKYEQELKELSPSLAGVLGLAGAEII